jgi:hypothetical protein
LQKSVNDRDESPSLPGQVGVTFAVIAEDKGVRNDLIEYRTFLVVDDEAPASGSAYGIAKRTPVGAEHGMGNILVGFASLAVPADEHLLASLPFHPGHMTTCASHYRRLEIAGSAVVRLAGGEIGFRNFRTGPTSSLLGNAATSDAHGDHRYHEVADDTYIHGILYKWPHRFESLVTPKAASRIVTSNGPLPTAKMTRPVQNSPPGRNLGGRGVVSFMYVHWLCPVHAHDSSKPFANTVIDNSLPPIVFFDVQ